MCLSMDAMDAQEVKLFLAVERTPLLARKNHLAASTGQRGHKTKSLEPHACWSATHPTVPAAREGLEGRGPTTGSKKEAASKG